MKDSKSNIVMNFGDVLIFPSEMKHSIGIQENVTVKKIFYKKDVDILSGSKKFVVTSTLIDKYEVEINAETEEEAIEKAKLVPISKWKHLDLYPDITDRKVIRYAKWFNFDSKPLT
jgi:hypothetical protein